MSPPPDCFDRVADCYDATRAMPRDATVAVAAGILRRLQDVSPLPSVLEVGIGTGRSDGGSLSFLRTAPGRALRTLGRHSARGVACRLRGHADMHTIQGAGASVGRAWLRLGISVLFLLATSAGAEPPDGRLLYSQHCVACHGPGGDGDGLDAALFVSRPRNLRKGYLDTHSTADAVRLVLDGRSERFALDLPALRERLADVESIAAHMQRIPKIDWAVTDQGQALFGARCAPCHGSFGRPSGALPSGVRAPRDLSDPAFQHATSDVDMIVTVRHGRGGMPGLTPRLSDEEARQVGAFVRVLSPGYATYTTYCAQCHGDHGIGVGSFGESYPVPTVVFDQAYFDRRAPAEVRRSVSHMLDDHRPSMPHYRGVLSESEATAIVEYLKHLPSAPQGSHRE